MDNDDLVAICKSIIEAGQMARPDMSDVYVDLSSTNAALYEIVGALKVIDCELTNLKDAWHRRLDGVEAALCDLAETIRCIDE